MEELREPGPEHPRVVGDPGRAHPRDRRAVIPVLQRDDLDLRRPAAAPPEVARRLERRLVGVDPAGGEEARPEPRVRERLEPRGQLERRRVGVAAVRVGEGEPTHLVGRRLDQLLAPVPQVDVPEARQPVDVRASLRILEADPLTADEDGETPLVRRIGHGVEIALVERGVARGHRPLLGRKCRRAGGRRDSMNRIVAARHERVKVRPPKRAVAAVDRQRAASCLDSPGPVAILTELSGA